MKKLQLRELFLARQKSLSSEERQNLSRKITEKFFDGFDLSNVSALHCFLPIEKFNEVNTMWIFEKLWKEFPDIKTFVPKINLQTGQIESVRFAEGMRLRENKWKIKEPEENESIQPTEIDMLLVPLLCFDLRGFRIGYGKGFYDKFLKKCRQDAEKVGLSYFEPVEKISDIREYDVKLDFCITPEKIFKF
jgi:5-formyltetrahydrofolate cyclo-ligase